MNWKMTEKSINSKTLRDEIHALVAAAIDEIGVNWNVESQRSAFTEMVHEFLDEVGAEGRITQWDVVCDQRNNKRKDMANGDYNFDVVYKQKHCLNTSVLSYAISKGDQLDFDLQF